MTSEVAQGKPLVAFVLAVAAAVEMAALFYMASDPDVSWSWPVLDASGVVGLVGTATPLAVVVFLFFTKPGRAFTRGLRKDHSS